MRRHRLVPMLALVLALGACGSNTPSTPRTVTTVVTKSGTPPPTSAAGSAGITVVGPGGSTGTPSTPTGSAGSATSPSGTTTTPPSNGKPSTTNSKPTTTTKAPPTTKRPPKVVKVDPLHVACPALLDNTDIKKALGRSVSSASSRIVDVANPDVKMTGKIKCYYGAKSSSKNTPVIVALAQYKSAHAAQAQMNVTASSEVGLGAAASSLQVSGHPARVLLRDGGLLVMRYDTWTLSIAVENKLTSNARLPHALQQLATMVLARVLKNG